MDYKITTEQKNKIDETYATIMTAFGTYKKVLGLNYVMMQPGLLLCAVTSWVLDEYRHTDFHPCKNLKLYKKASYCIYWFTKIKPIQILMDGLMPNKQLILINEEFALFLAYTLMKIDEKDIVPVKFKNEMIYDLRFRKLSPEALFTTMNLLEISAKSGELKKSYTK